MGVCILGFVPSIFCISLFFVATREINGALWVCRCLHEGLSVLRRSVRLGWPGTGRCAGCARWSRRRGYLHHERETRRICFFMQLVLITLGSGSLLLGCGSPLLVVKLSVDVFLSFALYAEEEIQHKTEAQTIFCETQTPFCKKVVLKLFPSLATMLGLDYQDMSDLTDKTLEEVVNQLDDFFEIYKKLFPDSDSTQIYFRV